MNALLEKYWHPDSLTWWTGVATLLAGLILQLAPALPALAPVTGIVAQFFPGHAGGDLIIAGLGLIGIKGAIATLAVKTLEDAQSLAASVNEENSK